MIKIPFFSLDYTIICCTKPSTTMTDNNNNIYGSVSEADIIQTMDDLLANSEGEDNISLAEF